MSVVGVVFAISCVAAVAYGGCQAGTGQELLTYDDEYKEPLIPPIQKVVRDVTTKRVECLEAYITAGDLLQGTPTNVNTRNFAKKMGYPGDEAGHLVARILGGTGYRTYNIVPQSKRSNTSSEWRTQVERKIKNRVMHDNVNASFIVEPQYENNIHPTRPFKLNYSFSFTDGTGETGSVDNPRQ